MKFCALFLLLVIATVCVADAEVKPKVQIGIKKRAENCTKKAKSGDQIEVHYRGTLKDGTEFDSSYTRGQTFPFQLGANQVIKGWDQGLLGMCEGEKRRLVIPPELGYGKSGAGDKIPPNSVLVFEVEMVKIKRRDDL